MLTFIVAAAAAQAAPGAVLIDRNRIDRAPAPVEQPNRPQTAPPPRIEIGKAGAPITGIVFEGAKAPAPVADAAKAFLGKPTSRKTLAALADALSKAYKDSDVALYTVAIRAQDLSRGVVTVSLVEGRIARVELKGDNPAGHPQLLRRLAPLTEETPLSRATFERRLVLARSIPGLTLKGTDFSDPRGDGTLLLSVTPEQKRHRYTLAASNRGVASLGEGQLDGRAEFYGVAADGDVLSVSGSAAADFDRYLYGSLGYAAPIGGDGLTASASAAYLKTRPRRYPVEGTARQANLSLSYPLIRDFHRAADVSIGIDGLNSRNATLGNVIASEDTRAVRAAFGMSISQPRRSISFSGSVSRGIDVLGARVIMPLSEATFTKATATAGIVQAVGTRGAIRLTASGQYSRDRLPAAERFAIGGEALGRAFDTSLLSGDRGGGALAEVAWRPLQKGLFATSEVYGFGDYAGVHSGARGPYLATSYDLASVGAGVRARYRAKAELGVEAAKSVDRPYPGYRGDWRVSVSWRVTA